MHELPRSFSFLSQLYYPQLVSDTSTHFAPTALFGVRGVQRALRLAKSFAMGE